MRAGSGGEGVPNKKRTAASDVEEAGKKEREAEHARHLQRTGGCSLPRTAKQSACAESLIR